ncbi:hypothetical protein ACFSKI_06970 [Pseudogracilibacillus auburnensis]|uniref:Lipoprotein n=1 Tax=Pseudogracilibacillus auburnensis TaxID=1494959 RepID=A0A2V3VP33_9BACI|nr:hypothetical protein [Pseudogracilibacillus auburnensis]MBO1004168.1 hypothetical protein [Pseudogracilibacillus auburnensis]PXW83592.1 hypothetical protein DFR56_11565 [Pseudogracilibacillus auburnensis]
MQKLIILFVSSTLLLGITACSQKDTDQQQEESEKQAKTEEHTEQNVDQNEVAVQENEEEGQKEAENEQQDIPDTIAHMEEATILADHIDFSNLHAKVETDNANKRVILFQDNDHSKKYKSIFIKNDQRLKIIDLKNDGLIYNDIIR